MSLVILLGLAAVTSGVVPPDMAFDDIDLERYNDKKNLENYVRCIMHINMIKECSDYEINVRERGAGGIANSCADCSPKEMAALHFIILKLVSNNVQDLTLLLKTYDPNFRNSQHFLEAINEVQTTANLPRIPESIINLYHPIRSPENNSRSACE